jgi:hypothetical protein
MVFPKNPTALRYAQWAMSAKPLAIERAVNVLNPEYLRFVVAGPGQYMVRLTKGTSLNLEVLGVFIDRADARRMPADHRAMTGFGGVNYGPPTLPKGYANKPPEIFTIWEAAKHSFGAGGMEMRESIREMCYRYAVAHNLPSAVRARMRWRLDIWRPGDRRIFNDTMDLSFQKMLSGWKGLKAFLVKTGQWEPNAGELKKGA